MRTRTWRYIRRTPSCNSDWTDMTRDASAYGIGDAFDCAVRVTSGEIFRVTCEIWSDECET